jgi:hypothetical protein
MDNHYHLLIHTPADNLPRAMRQNVASGTRTWDEKFRALCDYFLLPENGRPTIERVVSNK